MTNPTPTPLPIDVSGIDEPLPDIGHEAIRQAALNAIQTVWMNHEGLVQQLAAALIRLQAAEQVIPSLRAAIADLQTTVADLQSQVAALTPPPPAS